MENFKKLKELIESAEQDAVKFYEKGNRTAGTRLRIALQQTKQLAQEIRNEVTAKKNAD
ncbi:hypothetical protein [Mucilaginibacter paludis]|uniref:Histone H1 n=1 Tax=Mucilaginibacter paludis DSM 18603 TaxID=714943 RepID=H1YHF9_9SPHI|nr:hypothetical protein [Mucilaginibacter paludis]EHQ25493.1 hypothetical protein Mucpa_1331 [Mucilaginibacter paludis DSM 18603]